MCNFKAGCTLPLGVHIILGCFHRREKKMDSFVFIRAVISRSRLQRALGRMISIKTGCCLKASSCQAELPRWHRHHNRGSPSHNSVWLAQGENGSLWRARPAAGWQARICEARRGVYLLSFCLLGVSLSSAREAARTKRHGEHSPRCEEANTCLRYPYLRLFHNHLFRKVFWITASIKKITWNARSNDAILCFGPTHLTLADQWLGYVSDRSGGSGEKGPLGVLIMALLLPFAVTISRGGQDKRKAMFHLCCLGISNSEGTKGIEAVCYYNGGKRRNSWCFPLPTVFLYSPFFAVGFKYGAVIKAL